VGLGIDELSMAPGSIPEAKALIARLETGLAARLAEDALALGTASELEVRTDGFLADIGWTH
jgi:phosphoenolpyruvate-protein kinase (PTS system EI component)